MDHNNSINHDFKDIYTIKNVIYDKIHIFLFKIIKKFT